MKDSTQQLHGDQITNGSSGSPTPGRPLRIAIIGGGIVGVAATLGLLRRNMNVRLYEQASGFREIGAGLAFTTNAQKCMALLSPAILAAMKAVSTRNENPYYTYVDGFRRGPGQTDDDGDLSETPLYQLHAGTTGFDACHRAHFLEEMVKHVPAGMVAFGKRLETYAYDEALQEFTLRFKDGSVATADVGACPAPPSSTSSLTQTLPTTQSSAATASSPASASSSSAKTTRPRTPPLRTKSPSAASSPWTAPSPPSATPKPTTSACTPGPARTSSRSPSRSTRS